MILKKDKLRKEHLAQVKMIMRCVLMLPQSDLLDLKR
jgi:hypothetical protein